MVNFDKLKSLNAEPVFNGPKRPAVDTATLKDGLNDGQAEAFDKIVHFMQDPNPEAFVLRGYAGTGKTFLVKRIVQWINSNMKRANIAITAPTNKAVRVLFGMGEFTGGYSKLDSKPWEEDKVHDNIKYSTIHKLLGLKEKILKTGQQVFEGNEKDNTIEEYQVLIVDEVSMLSDDLCEEILKWSSKVKIIFMGDPAQIPPVGKVDCIPFRTDHPYVFDEAELTQIMRQTGEHPVVDASFLLRNDLVNPVPIPKLETDLNDKDQGIVFLDSEEDRESIRPLIKELFLCDEFSNDANHAKIIAWRNKIVNYMNTVVRDTLYGTDADRYVIGEKLIANSPIFKQYGGIQYTTSEELEIVEIKETTTSFQEKDYKLDAKVYKCRVRAFNPETGDWETDSISIIHNDSMGEFSLLLKQAKDKALRYRQSNLWRIYYNILKWNADVGYNYAITAHKAQGSTYTNVLLMEEDLDKNQTIVERNRIKYTAYSRPTDKLFIVRKNHG